MRSGSKFHKAIEEADEDGADWKDSYSDLMTDLLAIFVTLFSFAMINQSIMKSMATTEQDAMIGVQGIVSEEILSEQDGVLPDKGADLFSKDSSQTEQDIIEDINSYIDENGLTEQLSVTKQGDNQIMLRVAASILFDSGHAAVHSNAKPLLDRLSEMLTQYADSIKMVRIEGHTDNIPTNARLFASNWELSASRAVNVLKWLLEESALGPEKFSAVGYGEFQPIADNDIETGRARNRRVEFIIETINNE